MSDPIHHLLYCTVLNDYEQNMGGPRGAKLPAPYVHTWVQLVIESPTMRANAEGQVCAGNKTAVSAYGRLLRTRMLPANQKTPMR
jgi:hypothetical protein